MKLYIHDSRNKWIQPFMQAAKARGHKPALLTESDRDGYGLLFPHAHPAILKQDQNLAKNLHDSITLITDLDQIMLYEDKRGQTEKYRQWMPDTWIFTDRESALTFAESADYPLISKADVGASSYNVRLLKKKEHCIDHINGIFDKGIPVLHCDSLGSKSVQKDYVILQEFIPHDVTYRVNLIGEQAAIFYRYCYADRPMAQTGNVKPAYELDDEAESLLEYARSLNISKWVALDFLKTDAGWKLLETSLRWPWPSPGDCGNGSFFIKQKDKYVLSGRIWNEQWHVLIDELEKGEFDA